MKDIFFSCTDHSGAFSEETFRNTVNSNKEALYTAQKGEKRYSVSLGWHDVDEWAGEKWLSEYESLAAKVRKDADALVVIGIGGSNRLHVQSMRHLAASLRLRLSGQETPFQHIPSAM